MKVRIFKFIRTFEKPVLCGSTTGFEEGAAGVLAVVCRFSGA